MRREEAAVQELTHAVCELEREASRLQVASGPHFDRMPAPVSPLSCSPWPFLQDNTRAIGDIQRSLVTIASAWHACLDHAAVREVH